MSFLRETLPPERSVDDMHDHVTVQFVSDMKDCRGRGVKPSSDKDMTQESEDAYSHRGTKDALL